MNESGLSTLRCLSCSGLNRLQLIRLKIPENPELHQIICTNFSKNHRPYCPRRNSESTSHKRHLISFKVCNCCNWRELRFMKIKSSLKCSLSCSTTNYISSSWTFTFPSPPTTCPLLKWNIFFFLCLSRVFWKKFLVTPAEKFFLFGCVVVRGKAELKEIKNVFVSGKSLSFHYGKH